MSQDAAREIFPVLMDGEGSEAFTDFRPMPIPADAPEEDEGQPDPKDESAPESAASQESPTEVTETKNPPAPKVPTVPPLAGGATSLPKVGANGSSAS